MELSEAKEIMNELKNRTEEFNNMYSPDATEFTAKLIPTIDTVLKALDNSISKDDIRKQIKREEKLFFETKDVRYANRKRVLKELLGE